MEIIRIYNNNVAVVRGDDGKEMIVIGKGLVFQKHAGDLVEPGLKNVSPCKIPGL